MEANKYIRRLIRTYSADKNNPIIVTVLEDIEKKGLSSNWLYFIVTKAHERVAQKGIDPYDRKNKNEVYEALLDVFYEETDLADYLKVLGLNTSNVNEELLKKVPPIIQRHFEFIMKVLKRKGDNKIIDIIKDKISELVQWRRTYSSSDRDFLRKLMLGFATAGLLFQTKAADLPVSPNPQPSPKHQVEYVEYQDNISIILRDFERKVDSLRLEESFVKFYTTLNVSPTPKGNDLLTRLYNRAVFYTKNIDKFKSKFGNYESITNTLSELNKDDKRDEYIATVRDLFIASVAGGALEATWDKMGTTGFTDGEKTKIRDALYEQDYTIEFRNPIYNEATTNFSNVVVIKIRLDEKHSAELTLNIQSLNTFNFYDLGTRNTGIAQELESSLAAVRSESSALGTYNFYIILPNGVETMSQRVHYLGLVFNVAVKAYKVSNVATSDGTSSTVGMAKLKNKHSRMFRRKKKYDWM